MPIYFHIYHLGGKIHNLLSFLTIPKYLCPKHLCYSYLEKKDDRKGEFKLEYSYKNGNRYFESNPPHHLLARKEN